MEPGFIPSLIALLLALVFVITGPISFFTGKNSPKNRGSPLDKIHSRFRFYTCNGFQFVFGAILFFAAYQWHLKDRPNFDKREKERSTTELAMPSDDRPAN
jgi:hypothetical protein